MIVISFLTVMWPLITVVTTSAGNECMIALHYPKLTKRLLVHGQAGLSARPMVVPHIILMLDVPLAIILIRATDVVA